jgi:hypothetical protein
VLAPVLFALSVALGAPRTRDTVRFPALGPVGVTTVSPMYNPDEHASLNFARSGHPPIRFPFEMGSDLTTEQLRLQPFPARFLVANVPGIRSPLVVATAGSHGGSDASFETLIVAEVSGSLREVSTRVFTTVQDCVCFRGKSTAPEVLVFTVSSDNEAHYQPHFFTLRTLRWNGNMFAESSVRSTKRKQPSWKDAASELGVSCSKDLTLMLVPGER